MRLMRELPEIERQIGDGVISLTHIGLAQTLFRQEKRLDNEMSREVMISVLNEIANKPVREAEWITLSFSSAPELSKPERVHYVTPDVVELKFTASTRVQTETPKTTVPTKTAAPRDTLRHAHRQRKQMSHAQVVRGLFDKAESQCENCQSSYRLKLTTLFRERKVVRQMLKT